jgi:hypothetical protein
VQNLTLWDLVLTPIFLFLLVLLAKAQAARRYPKGHPLRTYFLKGLYVKFAGALFIALIYEFYYSGGDTYNYFHDAQIINSALQDSLIKWLLLITNQSAEVYPEIYPYVSQLVFYQSPSTAAVSIIAAVCGLLNGTTYMPIALLFAYLSYTGIWAMYRTITNIYPQLYKELAIAFLFIPSVVVWGSAVFKDTICMFGLGWLTYTTFRIFVNKDFSIRNILLFALSFYLIYLVKIYILLSFLPALSIWLLITYSSKIRSAGIRFISILFFIAVWVVSFFYFSRIFANELERYSLEKIAKTALSTRGWIAYASGEDGSAYDLGTFEPGIGGMLQKFPQAVVVTLFRPFLWESRKVIVLLSALEALLMLYVTVYSFVSTGVKRSLLLIGKDPNLLFFLIFSLIFAFAVGISTYNFGALSRYKIPCLPFYAAFLIIILKHKKLRMPDRIIPFQIKIRMLQH